MMRQLPANERQIAAFCQRWGVLELTVYGSALREDFGPNSDIDVMIRLPENHARSLFDMVKMRQELERLFGRSVDLSTRKSVERSRNPYRRRAILESAQVLYAA